MLQAGDIRRSEDALVEEMRRGISAAVWKAMAYR